MGDDGQILVRKKNGKKYKIRDYGDVKKEHLEFVCENVYI